MSTVEGHRNMPSSLCSEPTDLPTLTYPKTWHCPVPPRPGSPRLGGHSEHHCGARCGAAGSVSARFQTLLVYARKRDCLVAYYEGMLERCAASALCCSFLMSCQPGQHQLQL